MKKGLGKLIKKTVAIADQGVESILDATKSPSSAQLHRYGSSFPPTEGNSVKWFVDGKDYFYALSEALENATSTIRFIGWWVTPELFLRRPASANRDWRLDRVYISPEAKSEFRLGRAAQRGVKVYGVVYDNVALISTMDSAHTVSALEKVNPNIKVMRHPDHDVLIDPAAFQNELFWSHHDKATIIDDRIVYWGGLDSCFGRWDYNAHPLADLHAHIRNEVWVGQDYNNARIMDFSHVSDWRYNMLKRTESPRMPWHDVSMTATGPIARSFASHFIQRWNFVKKNKYGFDERYPYLDRPSWDVLESAQPLSQRLAERLHITQSQPQPSDSSPAPVTGSVPAQLCRSASKWSQGVELEHSIQNAYISLITNAVHFIYIENQFFITATGDKQGPIRNQIGKALVERIVRAATNGENFKVIVFMPAVPGFAANIKSGQETAGTKAIMDYQYISICRGGYSIMEMIAKAGIDPHRYISFFNLRSFDRIPMTKQIRQQEAKSGIDTLKADIALDLNLSGLDSVDSEHLTVSSVSQGDALDSIAHNKAKPPKNSSVHKFDDMFHWDKATGKKGKQEKVDEVLSQFQDAGTQAAVSNTIAAEAMETGHNVTDHVWKGDEQEAVKNFVAEELYIHTKLMIVDDRYVICGSANLNDRSQLGSRDSEVAVVIEEPPTRQSKMDGHAWNVSPFASSLRRRLIREHLGLLPPDYVGHGTQNSHPLPATNEYDWGSREDYLVEDPLSLNFWYLLQSTAQKNTEVFRDVFHAVPDDGVHSTQDYDNFVTKTDVDHVASYSMPLQYIVNRLSEVKGHVVQMPLQYMKNTELIAPGVNIEINALTDDIYT